MFCRNLLKLLPCLKKIRQCNVWFTLTPHPLSQSLGSISYVNDCTFLVWAFDKCGSVLHVMLSMLLLLLYRRWFFISLFLRPVWGMLTVASLLYDFFPLSCYLRWHLKVTFWRTLYWKRWFGWVASISWVSQWHKRPPLSEGTSRCLLGLNPPREHLQYTVSQFQSNCHF